MSCCTDPGCSGFFTERVARRDARAYRRKGLGGTSAAIARYLVEGGVEGATVLEVGGGVGALQLELLKAGASRATNVELSPAYEVEARDLAGETGLQDRIERRLADFARAGDDVPRADVVVMNRVVCCYPEYETLVRAAAERTGRTLVMTFPRDAWWTRAFVTAVAFVQKIRRQSFRPYVHPPPAILAAAERCGLEVVRDRVGPVWQLVALARDVARGQK